jgi:type IV secretion system protein VirB10
MVTTNVYSADGQRLLIPQGSRVLGEVRQVESFGQTRLAVVFHRLMMPNGNTVNLDQFPGLNQVGETGLRDQINHHYLRIFGVSLAIGAIAGLGRHNTPGVDEEYEGAVAGSVSQSSLRILDRYLNILPTFTIREGYRVKIHLSQDLLMPEYSGHSVAER